MPEGPSIVILKEELQPFNRKKVLKAQGNAKIDMSRLENKVIQDIKSHGKQLFICFKGFHLRIHLLMFGTYRINEQKDAAPRLRLTFSKGEVNFYTCSVTLLEGDAGDVYDWATDLMSDDWNSAKATKAVKALPEANVCDILLDQEIFSGSGNIIKNEVLFRTKIHPKSVAGALPPAKLKALVKDARVYSQLFYKWKKAMELKQHWQMYKQKECPRCHIKTHTEYIGKTKRRTFFCNNCQVPYT